MSVARTSRGARQAQRELIYLVAPSGIPNYGDEFIVRTWLRHLKRVRPDADVVVDCHTPGQAAVLLARWHPRVTFVDTAWRVCFETESLPAVESVAAAEAAVQDPGRLPKIASGIELLTRADIVHMVGGGYLNTVWPHHLALLAVADAAVRRSGGRAIATGQGLIPAGDPDRLELLRDLQSRFATFDVRDDPSYQAIAAAGGRQSYSGDDAWLGVRDDGVYDTESDAAQRPFVFCLQSDLMEDFGGGRGTESLAAAISQLIAQWNLRGEDVAFVECIPGADRIVFDKVAHLLEGAVFVPFTEVWNRGLPAREGQTWVSTRFHAHLLAAATGAAGLAISGRVDYYPIKHRSLVDAGSRWVLADSAVVPPQPTRGGFTPQSVERFHARKRALADQIYPPTVSSQLRRMVANVRRRMRD